MKNLVIIQDGQPVTSSLLVAQKFGKEHKNVLRDIENLVAQNLAAKFFIGCEYDNRGKKYPMYIMGHDGFSLLVMGFTGKEALKFKIDFIAEFNQMERTLQSGTEPPCEWLRLRKTTHSRQVASLHRSGSDAAGTKIRLKNGNDNTY
jgi:Rha family phage regulatory protein